MRILATFLEKTGFVDFGIQELLSLCTIFGIQTAGIFKHEHPVPPQQYPHLSPSDFPGFPYVFLDVAAEDIPKLPALLDRCVSVSRLAYVLGHGASEDAFTHSLLENEAAILEEVHSELPYSLDVKSHNNKLSSTEKTAKVNGMSVPPFKAKCDMQNPARVFLLEENYSHQGVLLGKYLIKSVTGQRKVKPFYSAYALSDRAFLGPTSTLAELAFMMCNQGLVRKDSLVFDPFVGTGSILLSAAVLGARCWGTDIDARVLLGYGVGQLNQKSSFAPKVTEQSLKVDVFLNFRQYGLELPEIIRADCSAYHFGTRELFDAIICDPPYGKRAAAKQTTLATPPQPDHPAPEPVLDVNSGTYYIPTAKASCSELTNKLFAIANDNLRVGGRLVFLYPVDAGEDPFQDFKKVSNFELVAATRNRLCTSKYSRFLFTFQKTGPGLPPSAP